MNYNIQTPDNISGEPGCAVTFAVSQKCHDENGRVEGVHPGQRLLLKNYQIVNIVGVDKSIKNGNTIRVSPRSINESITIVAEKSMLIIPQIKDLSHTT